MGNSKAQFQVYTTTVDILTKSKMIENTENPVEIELFRAEYRNLDAILIHDVESAKAPFQLETMVRYFLQSLSWFCYDGSLIFTYSMLTWQQP